MPEVLTGWLADLPEHELSALLNRRPDALRGRPPASLGDLAERWALPESLLLAVRQLPLPQLQALEALSALGERRTLDDLTVLLSGDGNGHRDDVVAVLAQLQRYALVWPAGGRLEIPAALPAMFPRLLGCGGRPLRSVWTTATADVVRKVLRAVGGRPEGRKADLVDALVARLGDPATVQRLLERAPHQVRTDLELMAWTGVLRPGSAPHDDDDERRYDPARYRQRQRTEQWATEHGLLVGGG